TGTPWLMASPDTKANTDSIQEEMRFKVGRTLTSSEKLTSPGDLKTGADVSALYGAVASVSSDSSANAPPSRSRNSSLASASASSIQALHTGFALQNRHQSPGCCSPLPSKAIWAIGLILSPQARRSAAEIS